MIGKHVLNYEIKSHLGEGGMGTVYRAGDSVLGREVALKMLHAPLLQQPVFLERFKKEARVLAQLLHPNITAIYNMIEQDNNHYMVMEFVEGKNLDVLLRQYKILPHTIVIPVFIQALEGLRHAHKKGIYHRDIKPSNLILTPDGTVKLMDFGIAMVAGEQRLTQANRVVGTIEYIAPEIIQGGQPSIATDIYAMGITMYELLTGKLPFEGNTDYNLMQDILKKKPVALDKMNASVPKALSNIVMKALEKKPEHRFADAKEYQQALLSAFPDMKYVELTESYLAIATQKAAPPATVVTNKKATPKPTRVQVPKTVVATKPLQLLSGLKEKILAKENRVLILCLLVVLITAVFAIVYTSGGSSEQKIAAIQTQENPKTEIKKENKTQETRENSGGSLPVNNNTIPITPQPVVVEENKKKEPVKTEEEKKKEIDKKKEADKKKKEDEKNKPVDEEKNKPVEEKKITPPVVIEKKEDKPIENKRAAKTIHITSGIEVSLQLRGQIDPETAKEGQSLSFTVTNPVRYEGETIIERGANATGRIKSVGKKKISIVITSVTAANGQSLTIQQEELSGRIEDMVRLKNFLARVKKGAVIML